MGICLGGGGGGLELVVLWVAQTLFSVFGPHCVSLRDGGYGWYFRKALEKGFPERYVSCRGRRLTEKAILQAA